MHVEIIETSPLQREVQVAVEASAVDEECRKALNQLRGRVKVRGFRPGKVPKRELERRYGKSVRRDVLKTLIQTTLSSALGREDLKTVLHVSPPEVVADSGEGGFSYRFLAEVKPEVTPKGYLGVAIESAGEPVTDEDIDREVEQLRKQHAIIEPIEDREVAEAEDWVTISYRRLDDEDAKPADMGIDLTDDTVPASLRDGVIGMTVDTTTTVHLEAPEPAEGEPADSVALEVTLQAIKRRTLPDVDDDLASMVGDFDTLAELRDEISQQLEARGEQARKGELRQKMEERLLTDADFDIPEAYLASRCDDEVRQRLQMFEQSQMKPDAELLAAVREQVRPDVERRVRLEFVLAAIAEREKVGVSDADIDAAIEELVRPAGAHAATLRRLYQKPTHRTGLKERLRLDKTLDFLLTKATISGEVASGAADAASTSESPQSADADGAPAATADGPGEADDA